MHMPYEEIKSLIIYSFIYIFIGLYIYFKPYVVHVLLTQTWDWPVEVQRSICQITSKYYSVGAADLAARGIVQRSFYNLHYSLP